MYQHQDVNGNAIDLPTGKVVCVGRNYMAHVHELNNATPEQPVLFIKPDTCLCDLEAGVTLPVGLGECHNEVEIAVLIGKTLTQANQTEALDAIWGYGIGLDLTLRDVQSDLKAKGLPWERAKAFDNACPVSGFVDKSQVSALEDLHCELTVNGSLRQSGGVAQMIWQPLSLLVDISRQFTLKPGDIVMTGTPKGVGPLYSGDKLYVELKGYLSAHSQVI